ncbi:MAG: winged helix-turn-helix domain-containing protein, partial [Xanthomonadales bacterium]|nr:winged helix-turn-helix domain-containing protein [Xanthomonadales bacterium]
MNIQRDQSHPFKLGDWIVKPSVDRIERNGVSKTLEPRAMDILIYLSQRPRAVVSIEHLITEVWAGQIVSDNTVYQWIRILRKALEDDPANPAYIETITKKGYRLVAQAEPLETETIKKSPRRAVFVVAAAIVVVAGLWLYSQRPAPGGGGAPLAPSIAVLPFVNHTGDAPGLQFADGIHDEVLTTLAKLDNLKVISRTSVMKYRDAGKDLPTIGEELGVNTVLEGGVQHVDGRVRINVQLIDARTDKHLWAETFDRELTAANIFAIQTEIANAVADSFEIDLSPAVRQ